MSDVVRREPAKIYLANITLNGDAVTVHLDCEDGKRVLTGDAARAWMDSSAYVLNSTIPSFPNNRRVVDTMTTAFKTMNMIFQFSLMVSSLLMS